MLQLQRASAGSGKTFTLAKKFIWFLIAIKDKEKGGGWRLRTSREIADGLKRILAITFTNKATNEMKQRIVLKLADLARAAGDTPLTSEEIKSITYLEDFSKELSANPYDIGVAAREALSVLLNDYSDFKVSTIDSFFQTVLRTFAYESNLNDTYQVEIDNDYMAAAAVNSTLNELETTDYHSYPRYWINRLMEEETSKGTKNWNVFQKSTSDTSIYTKLLGAVKRLENEDFKNVREKIDKYFDSPEEGDPLRRAYENVEKAVHTPIVAALTKAKKAAAKLKSLFIKNGLNPADTALRYMEGHLNKLPLLTIDTPSNKFFTPINMEGKTSVFKTAGKKKTPVASCPDDGEMLRLAVEMYDAYSNFLELLNSPMWLHWKVYAPQLPYLGLIGVTRIMMNEYLDANNTIQLGETNSMLHRIIGKDDAPYIYERLGARLNHFLIDEFQDTSRLQWENLLPLLLESNGRGEDNLIIGDAKQSIYRFRNADPSLITEAVPKEFPVRQDAGMTKEENTNWRSDRLIVEFNNYFFYALMERLAELTEEIREKSTGTPLPPVVDFRNLYANVVQYPSHRADEGYVEVRFLEAPETQQDESGSIKKLSSDEKTEYMRNEALSKLGPLISSLIDRGYRQSDIAILVRKNDSGKEAIEALVKYNATPGLERRIEFISEESLLVSSSEAVGIIINVLGKMANGSNSPLDKIRCNFSFYAMSHPDLPLSEQVENFLKESSDDDAVDAMLRTMQTVALPALVEAITENFVPDEMRRSQAVFIAALQDIVLEFTENHAADLNSFLDWWKAKGAFRSISSPEGTDAVQIMTIHKSKGLEFKCVIIPFDDPSLVPVKKSEWKWVTPPPEFLELGLPPFIPVETEPALRNTIHSDIYYRFFDLSTMDMLNAYYVAFTRAVSELYIFTKKPAESASKKASTIGSCLNEFFSSPSDSLFSDKIEEIESNVEPPELRSYMLPAGSAVWDDTHTCLSIGRPCEVKASDSPTDSEARVIEEYYVDSSPSVLQYVESDESVSPTELPDAEDTDPRSEGNLLHSILSMVEVPSDLKRSLLQHRMRGLITGEQAAEWGPFLMEAITSQGVEQWFRPGWRVLNEREILFPGMKNRRPDRMMITPDKRHGVIIDYKFGEIPSGESHIKQVKEYIQGFREVTHIHSVRGYIWYVRKRKIVEVAP